MAPDLATDLVALLVGGGGGVGSQPLVERDGEGEEFLFAAEGVNHLNVEFGVFERRIVEVFDVVEQVSVERGVGADGGGFKAKVVVVVSDLFVDGCAMDREGDERDVDRLGTVQGKDAAVDVVFAGGRDFVVVGGEELHARVFEGDGAVRIVGEDDTDGKQAVLDVRQAEEGAKFGVVAGLGGDGDTLVGVSILSGVLGCGLGGRSGFVVGGAGCGNEEDQGRGCEDCAARDLY